MGVIQLGSWFTIIVVPHLLLLVIRSVKISRVAMIAKIWGLLITIEILVSVSVWKASPVKVH